MCSFGEVSLHGEDRGKVPFLFNAVSRCPSTAASTDLPLYL